MDPRRGGFPNLPRHAQGFGDAAEDAYNSAHDSGDISYADYLKAHPAAVAAAGGGLLFLAIAAWFMLRK